MFHSRGGKINTVGYINSRHVTSIRYQYFYDITAFNFILTIQYNQWFTNIWCFRSKQYSALAISSDRVLSWIRFYLRYSNSRPEVFCTKGVLRNFTKLTGKHLCQSLFFNKAAGFSPPTLLKKKLWHRYFPVNFATFVRKPFIIEHLWWRFLKI